jgi:large-conductance mechanosensitive channel
MSYQERRSLVNLISTIVVTILYSAYMIQRYPQVDLYAQEVFHFWGSFFLILIPVSIVARIIIYILFAIVNAIATREEEPPITDERDKLVEFKSQLNSGYIFIIAFILAMGSLVFGMPPAGMFIILLLGGLLSEVIGDILQFFYYRRGF